MAAHLIYHHVREPVALVSAAFGPLRGPGPGLLCAALERFAGTGYCASSVHEKNTSPQPPQEE